MGKWTVAVCDAFDGYRERFVTYLMEHRPGEFAVYAFSSPEKCREAMREETFDAAVLGKGFEGLADEFRERGVPILRLSDKPVEHVAEGRRYGDADDAPKSEARVFRYQSMEAVLHELGVLAGSRTAECAGADAFHMGLEAIGVCSPIGHEMQMPFSLALSSVLAEKERILYVNLMGNSGFLELFQLPGEYDLGDVVLRMRNKRLNKDAFLRSVYQTGSVYYIPPFVHPDNLHDFKVADYRSLLEFLGSQTDFEAVVFDFGDGVRDLAEMLSACSSIYCLNKSGYYYECRANPFIEYLRKEAGEDVDERLHMINVPYSAKHIRPDGDVLRKLMWSEFGDYVRTCAAGGVAS